MDKFTVRVYEPYRDANRRWDTACVWAVECDGSEFHKVVKAANAFAMESSGRSVEIKEA